MPRLPARYPPLFITAEITLHRVLRPYAVVACFVAMLLGWLAAELSLTGALPRSVDAFVFCRDRLLCHLELRPGRRCTRRDMRAPLRQLMQQPSYYHPLEVEWAQKRGIKLADCLWDMGRMKRRWRELTHRPPLPAFYEGALCLRPRGRAPRSPALLVLPPEHCAHLRVLLLVPHALVAPEPCTLYYRELAAPRCPLGKAPWQVLASCHLHAQVDADTGATWHLLQGAVQAYALPVVEGAARRRKGQG